MIKIDSNVKVIATPKEMVGKKQKYKILMNDQLYIIKQGAINYEIYAELIAEKLGKQVGIDMAHYEVCEYNDTIGLITPVFLNDENEELVMSVKILLEASQNICYENNIKYNLKGNTIENIVKAAALFDNRINIKELINELVKRWIFYGMIMESDKNETNLSFIKNKEAMLRLSPDYDNSTMARMNENINDLINVLGRGKDIFSLTDNIKTALKLDESQSDEFIVNYREFVNEYGDFYKNIIESFKPLSIDDAIEEVEKENNIEVPWEVKFWLRKSIEARKNDMFNILNAKLSKENIKKI